MEARLTTVSTSNAKFEEIKISVPWGHISGKWHGSKLKKPIIALHGWQDNAGTFDTLVPLLPTDVSVWAIELPGHGFSSHIPNGMHYHASDFLFIIKIIMETYNWNTISLLAHSLGAMIAFEFSALFPEKVDFVIQIDGLKPYLRTPEASVDVIRGTLEKFLELNRRNQSNNEPPSYTYEECVDKLYQGSFNSVSKEHTKYLLNRNLKKSEIFPNKYYFLRDGRLKVYEPLNRNQEVSKEMARRIKAPLMLLRARNGDNTFYQDDADFYEIINILKKCNPKFIYNEVSGSHHVHLCEPEKVAKIINPFIIQHYNKENLHKKSKL